MNRLQYIEKETQDVVRHLLDAAQKDNFAGYDPFDGLNSVLFKALPFLKNSILGLAWLQLNKRSPVNLRPVIGVPKKRNPKGVALFILGMLENEQLTDKPEMIATCRQLADWLLEEQCDKSTWKAPCWGYHFDWKARAFYVPQGKPNVISTIYVSQALLALGQRLKEEKYIRTALNAADFIVDTLLTEENGTRFFAYIPGEKAWVHNASLWGAAWTSVCASVTGNARHQALALEIAKSSINEQKDDGSWVYGNRPHHQFIDGFHTGYNLEALQLLQKANDDEFLTEAIEKGFQYYKATFFESDGGVKYYHNNPYPYDMHSVAQAVLTLGKIGGTNEDIDLIEDILCWSLKNMYLPDRHQFLYQKNKSSVNKVNYIRWTQAWCYYALSFYLKLKGKLNVEN